MYTEWSPWWWILRMMQLICLLLMDGYPDRNDSEDIEEVCEIYLSVELPANATYTMVDISEASKQVLTVLYCVLMTLALLGNMCVIIVFASNKQFRTVTNLFILSLAISDLLITVLCMPFNVAVILNRSWEFGNFSAVACKMVPYMQTLVVTANILTLACIAIERYVATIHPLKAKYLHTLPKTLVVVGLVWLIAILFAIPNAIWYELIDVRVGELSDNHFLYAWVTFHDGSATDTLSLCMVSEEDKDKLLVYKWVFMLAVFLLPLLVMLFCYIWVGHNLWVREIIGNQSIHNDRLRLRTSRRVISMLVFILCLFVICWGPILIFEMVALMTDMEITETTLNIKYYLQWLALSNSCHNPFVYTFLHEKFRKSFCSLCARRKRKVSPKQHSHPAPPRESSRSNGAYF